MTEVFERGRQPLQGFRPIKIALNPKRELLYQRIAVRTARIFDEGLLEEVRALLTAGVSRDAKPFESLGYKQSLGVLEGRLTAEQAQASTELETRRYAKRQITWFRKEHGVHWLPGFGDEPAVQKTALTLLNPEM